MADARGPRLLADLNNIFRRDSQVDEFDILPVVEPKHNKSPFVLQNHKLGVEAWAVKLLFKYAANRLIGWRGKLSTEKFIDPIEQVQLTRAVLLFNADNYTAWNIRKELIENSFLTVSEDLSFGALVLTKHPKSPETFIHRRWLFQQLLDHCLSSSSGSNASCSAAGASNESCINMEAIDVDVSASPEQRPALGDAFSLESSRLLKSHTQKELELSEMAADKYPCNYHAWSHRMWIVQHCLNCSLQVLLTELEVSKSWTSKHISDHSGFHYRQFLLTEVHKQYDRLWRTCNKKSAEIFAEEMSYICDLITSFPGHEALWYHRRFVLHSLLQLDLADLTHLFPSCSGQSSNGFIGTSSCEDDKDMGAMRQYICRQELDTVQKTLNKTNHKYESTLSSKYMKWLENLVL